jgi:branched-chain amino acid transport system substrate-binding protein
MRSIKRTRRARSIVLVSAAAMVAVAIAGCGGETRTSPGASAGGVKEPIKVGAVLSLTGSYAGLGASEKKALDLEVKKINEAGGINGRPIELVIADDGTDAAKAQAATTKLIDQDKVVAVLGASGTGQTMAMRADVERAGVANVSLAGGSAITEKVSTQVFQVPWPNRIVVPCVLKSMKAAGLTRIGVLSDTGGYGKDGLAVIKAQAPNAGLQLVGEQTFNLGDTDMTAQLTKLKNSNPQAILLWTAGKEGATVLKNRETLKMTTPFYGGSGQARQEFLKGAGAAAEGFIFGTGKMLVPATWGTEPNKAVEDEFVTRYKAAYGTDIDIFAGHAFDGINIVADAAKKVSGEVTAQALRDAIEKTSGLVLIGGTYTFSPTDHNGLTEKDLWMFKVTDGVFAPEKATQ